MTRLAILAAALLAAAGAASAQQRPSPLAYAPPPPDPPPPSPLADAPPAAADAVASFYVSVDLAFLKSTVAADLSNPTPFGPGSPCLPSVALDWAVSPTFEVGYRLSPAETVVFSYRFLAAEGIGSVTQPDERVLQVRSRLDVQVFDLDYLLTATAMGLTMPAKYELNARVGARLADVFFDTRAKDAMGLEQGSNDFFGAGLHARLDVRREFALLPGVSVFGCADGAVLVGRSRQRFRAETYLGEATLAATSSQHEQQAVPVLGLQAGVVYAPASLPGLKFINGYQYERFFGVADVAASSGDVYSHGWFMRVRYDF